MSNLLTVSPSPHIASEQSVSKMMYGVIISLVPAFLITLYVFGLGALVVTVISILSCVLAEMVIQQFILKTRISIGDGSAMVTGLLLAFNLPSNLPWWMVALGALFAIGIGKMTYGGLGNNPFNPALVGRVFLLISFPVQMTSWPLPVASRLQYVDAATGATPLGFLKEAVRGGVTVPEAMNQLPDHMQLFMGQMGGSLGEVSAVALIIGFFWLLYKRIITWHIPVSMIATIFIFTGILWLADPSKNASPVFHILTGGIMLGAIYMATDLVTSPMTKTGMFIYAVGIGLITVIIRVYGAYPEGVSFAILIMNAFVPLINKYIKPRRFGEEVKHG
ncbi:MAG TPA: RnfABCDGE type electron transport complex subunit D [Bacteroidales bacterium]|nr:RnfABCDGE type electron transport complex subunit D [Bacteroidales bacterium]